MILTIATRSNGQFRHRAIDDRIPKNHLLRRINAFMTEALAFVHEQLDPYYSEIGLNDKVPHHSTF